MQAFSSINGIKILTALLLVTSIVYSRADSVESKKLLNINFGRVQTINIFPTQVETDDWAGVENVLVQDLKDGSLYQDFGARSSAYVPQENLILPDDEGNLNEINNDELINVNGEGATTSAQDTEAVVGDGEILPDEEENVDSESGGEILPEVETSSDSSGDVQIEAEPVAEPVSFNLEILNYVQVNPLATRLFPLAQLSITTTTDSGVEESDSVETTIEAPVTEDDIVTISEALEATTTEDGGQEQTVTEESASEIVSNVTPSEAHEIILSNFDTAPLDAGQFINGVQLRLSFAAQLENPIASSTAPYVEVLFGKDDDLQSVGMILLEDEVSNAINGGYFLFALPAINNVSQLENANVVLRYFGDKENLDGMFLDAAWLELNTRTLSKMDLIERGLAENLTHLKAPEMNTLLSEQLNFARTENPIFNLRYIAQRNPLIAGMRSLFGSDLVEVEAVRVIHGSIGLLEIEPIVNVTRDGLVSIEIPDNQLDKMRPGTYEIQMVFNEGGSEFVDTFNFEWGVLAINPNKSEYQVGETAQISIGALSPNGNTICEANLNLFITDPNEAVTMIPVEESGLCNGNNVVDRPDFFAVASTSVTGEHELYLERLDEQGNVISFTTDTFLVSALQNLSIERNGPTRIYPVSPYPMTLTISAKESFNGVLTERLPKDFVISSTTADITFSGDEQILTWNLSIRAGQTESVSYGFDAPDISPYLYNLGPATLQGDSQTKIITVASTTASTTEEQTVTEGGALFTEHRQWQIASDATGSMLLYWAGANIPTGWTCVSCVGGDAFYQRFIVGSSTAGNNGGLATHTHTAVAAVAVTGAAGVSATGGGTADTATRLHTHTLTPTIASASNLPSYRQLVVIQHNSAGEPTSIPTGAIALFDATVPTGWTQYNAQNGYYIRGESTANRGVTGGSNTHTHNITGTLSAPAGTTNGPGSTGVLAARDTHTHTISSSTVANSTEPPYVEAILGQLNATSTLPNDVITMWTDTQPEGWNSVSTTSQPFENKFVKASATYGTTGGANSHAPANVNGIVTTAPNITANRTVNAANADASGSHTHSVNVTGFSTTAHLPPYRSAIFAKRAGGTPPVAPTIYTLFDNEKTGTSTPEIEFTATDTVGTDSMIYQIQWDDDFDVATSPLGDRASDNETGCSPNCFENIVTPADTSPFNETERTRFTIQTALTPNTTYYWRVRAIKQTGSTWGAWSEIRSFTYVPDTDPSQWLQTTDAQFDQGVFNNTETYGSDNVRIIQDIPTESLVAYGEGVITTPRYRIWNGTAWSAEADALDIGGVPQWVRVVPGTTRDEYILGVHDANNDINMQVFDGVSDTWGDLQEVTATANDTTRRAFDVTYETNSGDAIVVYCSGTDAAYRTWNGATWSAATTITTASTNNCHYISVAADPTSDEIIMVARDDSAGATDYEAFVWSGSAWGNAATLGSITTTNNEGMSIQYEESGGQAMVVTANGAGNNFLWMTWNGTEWSTPTTQAVGNDFQWGILKADVGSDKLALCYIDLDTDIGVVRWDGEAWSAFQEFETAGYTSAGRNTSCEFETTSGRDGNIMIPYSDTTNSRYTFWNGTVLSAEASISTITEAWEIGSTRTGDGKILSYFHDSVNTNYDFSYWNGTAWSAIQTLETSASVTANPRRQPIGITSKIFQPSEGTLTSDPVDFSLVPSQNEWGEALWNVTEPAGSEVNIQVLYATSTNSYCNVLVPNGTLAGNSVGFSATSTPLDLSGLSTTTYSRLCLRANISSSNGSIPTLNDWTISWERQPYLVQSMYRWYVNANSENPSDIWPSGATDLSLNESIPVDYAPGSGDVLRLRMALRSDNAPLPISTQAFKLQYAETAGSCTSTTAWIDVGAQSSSTAKWRGYGNLLAFDGSDLTTLLLGSDVGGSYEEENDSAVNPNAIGVGQEAEWDWVLQHNSATDGVQYCFRMVTDSGAALDDYEQSPALLTNASPIAPTLEKLFDNEQVASTTPWFEFVTTDAESDDVSYQVQVDNNYDFSSVALDRNSISNVSEFENIVNLADKDPFTTGQTVRFIPSSALTNNTTYYWRVRAKDVNGSNDWGDWSTINSFTVNTGTIVTTWYQTEQEQFDTNDLSDTETTASDDVILTTSFTVGTTTGTTIDYDDKTTGNAWGELSWNDNEALGTVTYRIEYLNAGVWELVPNTFLPGNSSGFNTSPVSLLGLDPQVHNEIRVRANLVNTTGTPRLLDWKVEWGFAVEQPFLVNLFDNEKTGTTTPTFTFHTTDPDSDDVQYEISWSTDNTFATGTTTPRSGVSSGFANVTNGGDTSPFNSGDTISYTVQPAGALTNGQTYWWKVRARDPLGGNVWSVWSEARSFTVDTTVSVSTWFQTTDEQFDTATLNDTETTGSDSVEITSIIREAFTAYAEGTVQTPRYRTWNGSTWSAESSAVSVGGAIRFVEVDSTDVRDEYMIATQDSTGRVRAQVYDGVTDIVDDLTTIVTAVPSTLRRGYDIAYESSSGDAMVVACEGTEATYKIWDGASWSASTAITLAVTASCNWVQLASDPVSDEIILVVRDATTGVTDYEALVWSGSAWGNSMTMGSMAETGDEGMAVEYEESGDRAVVVVSNGINASFSWNSWNGTAWSGAATQAYQDDFEGGRLVRDLGSDNMVMCGIDQDTQMHISRWTGTSNSWNAYNTVELTGNLKTGRPITCEFETTTGRDGYIMTPYSDTTNGRSQFWNGSVLSGEASISTVLDAFEVRSTRTGDGNILTMFYDDDTNTQYDFSYWNGTAWSTLETLETSAITTTNPPTIPFDVVERKYPTFTEGTVVSDPIVFSEGSGLKWQQASFSDTTPGASNILYQIEYYNGSTWALIPDSALSGNAAGFTTSPIDLSAVSRITYNTIRMKANLSCSGGNCPTLNDWTVEWSAGINVAGTLNQYNQTSSSTDGTTVAIAVNGTLQAGKTDTTSSGVWSIGNVTAFEGDIVTVFVLGAADSAEAVGVTRYDGDGDITGMTMYERHLTLGSNDATTTPLTNANIGSYDFTNTEDIFFNVTGTTLSVCADTGCSDAELYVRSATYFTPTGRFVTHDFENNGTFTAGSYTHELNGSWDNNATTTMTGSTILFAATSTTEIIDSTGALSAGFNNVTFGTTTGNGTWNLSSTLDINGNLTVTRGTLARGTTEITLAGNLLTETNGFWTGTGTTTFDGSTAATWRNQNATLQNVGKVAVDGSSKAVTLASNVAAESITIGANDTLDASVSNYDITVYGNWNNQNNFIARSGEVLFAAGSSGKAITTAGDAFYDLSFTGIGGGYSFTEASLLVNNNVSVATGTVTMPTGTTTIAGSFNATGGTFAHNNGTLLFTAATAKTITFAGGAFSNVANNLVFTGAGSWTITDTNATSTNDVRVTQGTINFPSGVMAIGGRLADTGGVFNGGTGIVNFYSSSAEILTSGGSSFNNVVFNGSGSWSFSDANADANGYLRIHQGTLNMPSGIFTVGGSYDNNATVVPGTGTLTFDSSDTGETVDFGSSSLYNVIFNQANGGWTMANPATTTNNFTLTSVRNFDAGGKAIAVNGVFTNNAIGASTTWTGSTLSLEAGNYSLNSKTSSGDVYETLRVKANTDIAMWNSMANTYVVDGTGSLYSQDHNNVNGALYIFGGYSKTGGTEYWNYATDFDGTALGGSGRQVNVRFASGASASFTGTTFNMAGISTASTTIANQGSGTYIVNISGGTTTAQYYQFADLGATGVSFLSGAIVSTLRDGAFTASTNAGAAITLSSTTIDANPAKQIYNVTFATSSAISAYNVAQTDGTPASYWWFREGQGNLYGENYDNDTGNPGSVRFDDSSLVITVEGTVYSDAGVTPIVGGTCDGSTAVVKVVVNGGTSHTGSCSNIDGSFSIPGVTFTGDPTLTIYLDNASGGQKGSVITRTPTADILDLDIYANRVIVRNEDVAPLTIANLAVYDSSDDADLRFSANTATNPDELTVSAGNELFVWSGAEFAPAGIVTLAGNAAANSYDGTLYIDDNATFTGNGTTTYTIGGRLVVDAGATFSAASSTVLMNATTSGKSITSSSEITFHDLVFNGVGGGWNIGADIQVDGDMDITNGTVTGTGDIYISNGSLSGNGALSLGAGTTTLARTNSLGGTSAWTFYNLELGNTFNVGTTTPLSSATTTVSGRLTINSAHYLDGGSSLWDLAGAGTVFVRNGTFLSDTTTVRYSGAGSSVLSTTYYNLDINAGAGSPTYTATGLGMIINNNLTIGGTGNATFNVTANDPSVDVNGDLVIRSNGTLSASNSNTLTVAGDYDNNGTFTSNSGTITFDGTGNIAAGNSSFGNVRINTAGNLTVTEHATATGAFRIYGASNFTVASGQALAVGTTFYNALGGGATTWTGSTLRLYGGGDYSINAATTSDSYATLAVDGTTQIRMWNSDAGSYVVPSTASLYSQDHAAANGDLYIWGTYTKTSANDYWSYATDFDGTSLSGSERKVDVFLASGASVRILGGALSVFGVGSASTTIQNQGSGSYSFLVGGNASTSFRYYEVRDTNSAGLTFTGSAKVNSLSYGDFEVSQNAGSAITVGGTVINANPAKNFTQNRFALDGVGSGFNVTATGTAVSSWRFANHYGDIDGEAFDVDPNGDPGYIAWDDSAALITVSGNVYSDEGVTDSAVCDGVTNNVTLRVAGITTYSTTCDGTTGYYEISSVSYGPTDSMVVYIDGETEKGATVTKEPISNINGLHIYENRVIVRHEGTDPVTIANMSVWDSTDDADVPFTAVDGSPDTLTLPANRKLLVWDSKEFEPGGNVTVSGGGAGADYDGTVELQTGATFTGAGTESLSIGGSFLLGSSATFVPSTGTTTFTTTGSARTIDINAGNFYHIAFTGSGSWTVSDPILSANGNFSMTNGSLTLPTGTSTFAGNLIVNGGSFNANNGLARFTGTGTRKVKVNGSNLAESIFTSGNYSFLDTNATTTKSVTISGGTLTLPSGVFKVGGNFRNTGGSVTHNTSDLALSSTTAATLLASSSDLYTVKFVGGGAYTMEDENLDLLDSLIIQSGDVTLASGTLAIGGDFNASGGTFDHASGTILFNSADVGETINAGASPFYAVQIGAPTGGYTISANATTTDNFSLVSAAAFTLQSGSTLVVEGVFSNLANGANTTWTGSTLKLDGQNAYTVNTKAAGADQYATLIVGDNSDIRFWNSSAGTYTVDATASVYSQDHANTNGLLNIYGDFHISTTTEYWSYATDFDGTSLSGSERAVTVQHASNASTTLDGGTLRIIGVSGNETTITNQGSGNYAFAVSDGTFTAQYYELRNLNASGLTFSGAPTITTLSYGDYELAVNGGTLITLASSTLNANASMVIIGNRFATTSAITGSNVTLDGSTSNAWTYISHTGNLDGEDFDDDGIDACGSIRWSDSACLLTQQTNYRWRNDDGGLEVPTSEWYNTDWGARKYVRVENVDATTYSNAAVQMFVTYDADMQGDFDDLRFTSSDGLTIIPHWIGSSTDSVMAEIWVKVPSLAAEDTTDIFMYFNHPTATTSSSVDNVFIAADDFEDDDITEYSGQTTLFNTGTDFNFDGTYGLDNFGNTLGRANTGGIYRFDQTVSQGETFRFMQYVDTSAATDETCTKFAIQGTSVPNDNYAICLELPGTDHISLVRNVVDNEASADAIVSSSTVTLATGWYEVEVDWGTDDSFAVTMTDSTNSVVASFSTSDSNYTSGGIGFTYWYNSGGWDSISSRPTLATEPTVLLGAKQSFTGASWKALQNTVAFYDIADVARLRVSVENSGLSITNQQFLLEYAPLDVAPSCEAVDPNDYVTVPPQSSCGTSPVCMQTSTYITNGAASVDLLRDVAGLFTAGEVREDPSNITTGIDIDQDEYTEIEYAITPTSNVLDENLCFRVTDNGTDLDTYLKVAQLSLQFDPAVDTATLNDGGLISLLPGTTTRVYATSTVTDLNGYTDLVLATSTIYRSGVTGGASCTANNNDCYISTTAANKCEFIDCVGNTCTVSCYADIYFHADPTDDGAYVGQEWLAFIEVEDNDAGYGFNSAPGVELSTLRAIDTAGAIDYGALAVNSNTGSYNASTTVLNQGNVEINIEIQGTDLSDGASSVIPASYQKFATSTFTYSACGASCELLSSTTPVAIDVELGKPTVDNPPIEDDVFWGIEIPIGVNSVAHQGINVFTPISP